MAQTPLTVETPVYSTHDWSVTLLPRLEAWADVKTPGDGRQYTVGTIEVADTQNNVLFSDAPVLIAGFALPHVGTPRQVVMVQVSADDVGQDILWQRFFYGVTLEAARHTNARAISVWPAATEADTRVAICGETYDEELPLSQASFPVATATSPTGFIAVFDGGGTLLWTHHVFGSDPTGSCAITDLSMRVEVRGGVPYDVVTYCGISSHGVPATGTPLFPVRPFDKNLALHGSSGSTDQGLGQWDGVVGRVTRTAGGTNAIEFHSIVGGDEQDGLFGIAEFDETHFVVVGGTKRVSTSAPASGSEFPGAVTGAPFAFNRAAVLTFSVGAPAANLVLVDGYLLGSQGETNSLARDVIVLKDGFASGYLGLPTIDPIVVVGSTDDAQFFTGHGLYPTGVTPTPPQYVMRGATDGFVSLFTAAPLGSSIFPFVGAYHGDSGNDGLTGVQYWSEYPDVFAVVGFTDGFETPGSPNISVETFYVSTEQVVINPLMDLRSLRRTEFGASGADFPAAMGQNNATTLGLPFLTGPLGMPAGGGIAVDQRARINVVGQTQGPDYPVEGGGRAYDQSLDAVRTVLDMLPPGIGRTDGTGVQPTAFSLPSGFSGGTTPLCALASFGKQIGMPAPAVPRMLIQYEGPDLGNTVSGAAIIVSRPTAPWLTGQLPSSIVIAGWQIGLPGVPAPPVMLPSGVELFTTAPDSFFEVVGLGYPDQAFRLPLLPLPGGTTMTVQMVCYVPSFVPGGLGAGPCTGVSDFTATPAMWLIVP